MAQRTVTTTICIDAGLYRRANKIKERRGGTFREVIRRALEDYVRAAEAEIETSERERRSAAEAKASQPGGPGRFAAPTVGAPLAAHADRERQDRAEPERLDAIYEAAALAIVDSSASEREIEQIIDRAFEDARRASPLRHPARDAMATGIRRSVVLEVQARRREGRPAGAQAQAPAAPDAERVVDVSRIRTRGDVEPE